MATGACGIDCSTCRLHLQNTCSSCGGGRTELGYMKQKVQEQVLGAPCPILACARMNRVNHCMADCDAFPCEVFSSGTYPYSEGFLRMQRRRREEGGTDDGPGRTIQIPRQHWQSLQDIKPDRLQRNSGGTWADDDRLVLSVLNRKVRIITGDQRVEILHDKTWVQAPRFLAFVTIVYLINAEETVLNGRWVSEKDLSCASFFRTIHQLPLDSLLDRFGNDPVSFIRASATLGGVVTNDPGDAAVRLWVFPQIPVKLILWCRDDEMPPSITVLFDYSIEKLLPADGIWAMAGLLGDALVEAAGKVPV